MRENPALIYRDTISRTSGQAAPIVSPVFYHAFGKRMLDVTLTLLLAPPVLLVLAVLAAAMKLSGDNGPFFFVHTRIGRNGKAFRCLKVRSMEVGAESCLRDHLARNPAAADAWHRDRKLSDDPRITRFGRILRKTSLDELPQLWNVLKGDMSLVGPRPIVRSELHKYGPCKSTYLSMRPGVTGLWQVSGRNDTTYAERVMFDVDYARDISFLRDLWVIGETVGVVVRRTGK